jgi:lipoate-protein ligase A
MRRSRFHGRRGRAFRPNDITIDGKKVSGTAQRLYKGRILHHGTLLFDSDHAMVAGALNVDPEKFRSKAAKSVRSRIGNIREMLPEDMDMDAFKARLLAELSREGLVRRDLDEDELPNQKSCRWEIPKLGLEFRRVPPFSMTAGAGWTAGILKSADGRERRY